MTIMVAEDKRWACNGSILSKLMFIFMVSFILQHHQVQGECNLKIVKDGQVLTNSGLCIEEFNSTYCKNFSETFNRSDLPPVFNEKGYSVEKPDDIQLQPLMTPYGEYIYPGIRIVWEPPFTASARDQLDGYFITLQDSVGKHKICRFFKFNESSPLRLDKQLQFWYDVNVVQASSNYSAKVYSLPPPPPESKDDYKSFVTMLMTTPARYNANQDPGRWAPSLTVKTWNNGTVNVGFTLSPPNLNLTDYTVMLMKLSHDPLNPYLEEKVQNAPAYTPEHPQGSVFFNNLKTDDYQIVLWVEDKYHKQEGKCQCWVKEGDQESCTNICGSIKSQVFTLNVTEPVTPSPAKPDPTSTTTAEPEVENSTGSEIQTPMASASTSGNSNSDKLEDYQIALIVVGILVVLLVALLIFCYRKRLQTKAKVLWRNWQPSQKPPYNPSSAAPPICPPANMPSLRKKTVYIMASRDHEAFTDLVESLALFLKVHCYCDVIYYPWDDNPQTGKYEWFVSNINKAERIICVDSEGAAKLWEAHLCSMKYNKMKISADVDLFNFGIQHIHSIRNGDSRADCVVHVGFGEEHCRKYLLSSTVYKLPEAFPQFLQKLHDLPSKSAKVYSTLLPMYVQNLGELPEGAAMLKAMESSAAYEKNNPDWLKQRFGQPTPITQRETSVMSLDSGVHMMASVSNPDLSIFGANTPSPQSMYGKPDFNRYTYNNQPPRASEWHSYNYMNKDNDRDCSVFTIPDEYDTKDHQMSIVTLPSDSQSGWDQDQASQIKEVPWTHQQGSGVRKEHEIKGKNSPVYFNGLSVVPPVPVVLEDSLSTAFRNINRQNLDGDSCFTEAQSMAGENHPFQNSNNSFHKFGGSEENAQQAHLSMENFQEGIKPPDSFSDYQIDSFSSAMAEINAESDVAFMNEGRLELQDSCYAEPDISSI